MKGRGRKRVMLVASPVHLEVGRQGWAHHLGPDRVALVAKMQAVSSRKTSSFASRIAVLGSPRRWERLHVRSPPNKALQLTANNTFKLEFGTVLAFNPGGSATLGGALVRS